VLSREGWREIEVRMYDILAEAWTWCIVIKSREALVTTSSIGKIVLWTHQLSRSCLDSCLRIAHTALIHHCRFEYKMGADRTPDASLDRDPEQQ
jgi:hypothetical protein